MVRYGMVSKVNNFKIYTWYTLRMGRVDPPKMRIVKRTIISVEVTRTDLCSASNWSWVLKENATAPRRPAVTIARCHGEVGGWNGMVLYGVIWYMVSHNMVYGIVWYV